MANGTDRNEFDEAAALAAFERLLDGHGSVAAQWPADRRTAADALLRGDTTVARTARRALAEAQALDAVLQARTPQNAARVRALAERIVATAKHMPRPVQVIDLDRSRPRDAGRPDRRWMTAALLAASLLLGLFVGPAGDSLPALQVAADAVGLGGYVEQLALAAGEDGGLHDEDVL